MLISDFDFSLPAELIAQRPLRRRDASRMLVLERRTGSVRHERIRDFPRYVSPGEVLVFNATRVLPARAWGAKDESDIEFLFLGPRNDKGCWEVLCRPARRVGLGSIVSFSSRLTGRVTAVGQEGRRTLDFGEADIPGFLKRHGFAPLPPYIRRDKRPIGLRANDLKRYQTVYARKGRSIAAPTAGLHFTPSLLRAIRARGGVTAFLSLEVGPATFQPIRSDVVEGHVLPEEDYCLPVSTARAVNAAKHRGLPVTAVGTTVVRTLESAARKGGANNGPLRPGGDKAGLFIHPGFDFQIVDRLLTNFHLPKSSLFILTAAFAGRDSLLGAYQQAIRLKYRFFSYGDCMLIL